jgi:hypothetical protein
MFKMTRNILGTEPRVTRFKINWDDSEQPSTSNGMQANCHVNEEDSNLQEMDDEVSSLLSSHADNSLSQSPMEVL